jgi:glutaminase
MVQTDHVGTRSTVFVQADTRRIIAAKTCALQKRHNEIQRYFMRNFGNLLMDYHTLMDSYEVTLDALVQLLSLEGLSPSEIALKIQGVADHTDSLVLLKKEIVRSLDAFDIRAPLRSPGNRTGRTPPAFGGTRSRAEAGVLQ